MNKSKHTAASTFMSSYVHMPRAACCYVTTGKGHSLFNHRSTLYYKECN